LPRTLAKDADELVARIARAAQRPEWAIPPLVRKRTPAWRAAAWLQLWAEAIGEERRFAAGLALPRPLVESLILNRPADRAELRARLGWRDALCGDGLLEALDGRAVLTIDADEVRVHPRSSSDRHGEK
jgi:hypothetical protein